MITKPTCGQLLASWLLITVGFGLICRYEHVGFLLAFLPLVGAQRIRDAHDSATIERCKESSTWKVFAVIYYLGLLAVGLVAVMHHHHIANDPMCLVMIVFFLPFILAMVAADYALCSSLCIPPMAAGYST